MPCRTGAPPCHRPSAPSIYSPSIRGHTQAHSSTISCSSSSISCNFAVWLCIVLADSVHQSACLSNVCYVQTIQSQSAVQYCLLKVNSVCLAQEILQAQQIQFSYQWTALKINMHQSEHARNDSNFALIGKNKTNAAQKQPQSGEGWR